MKKRILMGSAMLAAMPSLYAQTTQHPNIIFILADDLGYGDIASLNKQGKVPTPNIDRFSEESVVFTDAHSSSAVSTPSRYGILTGRYNWRSRLKRGVMSFYDNPLMDPLRTTMASMLRTQGYRTACIGKWHLGMKFATTDGQKPVDNKDKCNVDFHKEFRGGPRDVGFDYFFGVDCPNYPPYCFLENRKTVGIPTQFYPTRHGIIDSRGGRGIDNWDQTDVLPAIIDKAASYIDQAAKQNEPFFLYLPLTSPHTPIVPTKDFLGKTQLNEYTDFVMQTDAGIGKVLEALKRNGLDENTLVVFTADNGCSPVADFPFLTEKGHDPSYIFRGMKSDLYEGGHHIACMVRWPEQFAPHKVRQTICSVDFMATFASLTGYRLADNEAEDSYNIWSLLKNESEPAPIREATVHHSIKGEFAIRQGDWKLLLANYSGGWSQPSKRNPEEPPYQLFNLKEDPEETKDLSKQYPEKVQQLRQLLIKYVKEGRSTPGIPQQNDPVKEWPQLKPWMEE